MDTYTVHELLTAVGIAENHFINERSTDNNCPERSLSFNGSTLTNALETRLECEDILPERDVIPTAIANTTKEPSDGLDHQSDVFHGNNFEKKKRRKKACPAEWKRNKNKSLRMTGSPYYGFQTSPMNTNKKIQTKLKPAKKMGPTCTSKKCLKIKTRCCNVITEKVRQGIFDNFWTVMDWKQRRTMVSTMVDTNVPAKNTKKTINSRRKKKTCKYYLKVNYKRIQVCKMMFINTLGVTRKIIENWTKHCKPTQQQLQQSNHREKISYMNQFFTSLPVMPSHYCRKNSTKLYTEPIYNSKMCLYRAYEECCKKDDALVVSRSLFYRTIENLNYAIFHPKKDQCDICCSYSVGNIQPEVWNLHIDKKNHAREEKATDKKQGKKGDVHVLTMDLESVKVSPNIKASAVYFKTKLISHNFTVYNINSHQSTCYWWNESEGDLQASTYASCIVDHIKEHYTDSIPIIIFSDGCTYQNRNAVMSNALLNLSVSLKTVITQKFLERGHTQMECDSVHSAIESNLKNKEIYLPNDYIKICREARHNPAPYDVKELSHEFFKNYALPDCMMYSSIRPGKKVGDPVVTDIKMLKYDPTGIIFYKLNYTDSDWKSLPRLPKGCTLNFPNLHNNRLKITSRKYQDLQDLKLVLPAECHQYYDSLPHASIIYS